MPQIGTIPLVIVLVMLDHSAAGPRSSVYSYVVKHLLRSAYSEVWDDFTGYPHNFFLRSYLLLFLAIHSMQLFLFSLFGKLVFGTLIKLILVEFCKMPFFKRKVILFCLKQIKI